MNYGKKAMLVAGALLCLNFSGYAQSVAIKMNRVTVEEAIAELQNKSGYSDERKEAVLQQATVLQEQVKSLQGELLKRLPLADFIAYAEELPAEQNGHALAIKTMLLDLFNGQIAEDEKERIRKLGRKSQAGTSFTVQGPLNDIHGNEYVKAGMQ